MKNDVQIANFRILNKVILLTLVNTFVYISPHLLWLLQDYLLSPTTTGIQDRLLATPGEVSCCNSMLVAQLLHFGGNHRWLRSANHPLIEFPSHCSANQRTSYEDLA